MEAIKAIYIKKHTKEFEATDINTAQNIAESMCPNGYELLELQWAKPCAHPMSKREYIGNGLLYCNRCRKEFS